MGELRDVLGPPSSSVISDLYALARSEAEGHDAGGRRLRLQRREAADHLATETPRRGPPSYL